MIKKFIQLLIVILMFNAPTLGMDNDNDVNVQLNVTYKKYRGRKEYQNWRTYLSSYSRDSDTVDERPDTCGSGAIKFLPLAGGLIAGGLWTMTASYDPFMLWGLIVAVPGGAIVGTLAECTIYHTYFRPYDE